MDQHFDSFAAYLADRLPTINVRLDIRHSKFCRRIETSLRGVEDLLAAYEWRSYWVDERQGRVHSSDWTSTKASIAQLSARLRDALSTQAASDSDVLRIATAILQWGGDRDARKGAFPFLHQLAQAGQLAAYIRDCAGDFDLSQIVVPRFEHVRQMNSMLTKIHAFASQDGLPIYDSRVAAAIATLAEQYRREFGSNDLPESICFPTTDVHGSARHVRSLYPDAVGARVLYRSAASLTVSWSSAKWRLGKLMHSVLERAPRLFTSQGNTRDRCHALEASLFMIGYNPRSIVDSN